MASMKLQNRTVGGLQVRQPLQTYVSPPDESQSLKQIKLSLRYTHFDWSRVAEWNNMSTFVVSSSRFQKTMFASLAQKFGRWIIDLSHNFM